MHRYHKKERVQLSEEQRKQLELKRKQHASKLSWNEGADDGRGLRIVVLKHVRTVRGAASGRHYSFCILARIRTRSGDLREGVWLIALPLDIVEGCHAQLTEHRHIYDWACP